MLPFQKSKKNHSKQIINNFESSITCRGRNNPLRNGRIDNIIKEMVDEAIADRQYQMKQKKLYSAERASNSETVNAEQEQTQSNRRLPILSKQKQKLKKKMKSFKRKIFKKIPIKTLDVKLQPNEFK